MKTFANDSRERRVKKNAKTQTRPQGRSTQSSPGLPCEQHGPVQSGGRAGGAKASNGTKDTPEQTEPARNVYAGRIMGRSPDIKTFASAGCQYCFGAATDEQGDQGIYIDVKETPMYKPLEFIPQQTRAWRIQPSSELTPVQEQPGPWTTIAHKLWRVIAVLASLAMVYLVWMAGMGRW